MAKRVKHTRNRAPMRIRNVSPKVFQNYDLDDAEVTTNLPLFKALVGLWCHADREGRFAWDLRKLQVNIFPFRPQVNISGILAELARQDVIRQYEIDGVQYGWLPTFVQYQYISNNEPESLLPHPCRESSQSEVGATSESSEIARLDKGQGTVDKGLDYDSTSPDLEPGDFRVEDAAMVAGE